MRNWDHVTRLVDAAGDKKYTHLDVIVKAGLTLSHGNAALERGFKVNNSFLSNERLSLGEDTLCAERPIEEAVRVFGSVSRIPITKV